MNLSIAMLDDDDFSLKELKSAVSEAEPKAEIITFNNVLSVMQYFDNSFKPDYIFIDIDMPDIDGRVLAKKIRFISPRTKMVFITENPSYAAEAYSIRANGFIVKPVTKEVISDEIDYLNTIWPVSRNSKRIRAQTFGNFDVFIDEKPLKFRYGKTKELLAWLIDRRGARSSTLELCAILWEDAPVSTSMKNQCRNLVSDLKHTLERYGCEDLIIRNGSEICIDTSRIDCDLYRYLNGDNGAAGSFCGEYMSQFSWAEVTLTSIENNAMLNNIFKINSKVKEKTNI